MIEVALFPGLRGARRACLGPLTGAVESSVDSSDPAAFGLLVDHLLESPDETAVAPGSAADLALSDLDRIALRLYRQFFGDEVGSIVRCQRCTQAFEVSIGVAASVGRGDGGISENGLGEPDEEGYFSVPEGGKFRLPTLRDLIEIRHFPPENARQTLLQRCTGQSEWSNEAAGVLENAMEAAGPLASGTVDASCPHCHFTNTFTFAIQQLVVDAIAMETRFLYQEIHYMAGAYGWSRSEIISLPRRERWQHVRMILAERMAS